MKVAYIVSDLTYPPREGLHQQTLVLIKSLMDKGIGVELHGFTKSMESLDLEAMRRELGVEFNSTPIEAPGSLLFSAFRNRYVPSRRVALLKRVVAGKRYDLVHCEGIATAAIPWARSVPAVVLSFIDPGSRRNFRFAKTGSSYLDRGKYLFAGVAFFFFERKLRMRDAVWHVVSAEDRRYLHQVHGYSRIVDIPVAIPEQVENPTKFTTRGDIETPLSEPVRVLIYADLRLSHMRAAVRDFAENLFRPMANNATISYIILGRVQADEELAEWFTGLDLEVIAWADDYLQIIASCDVVILPDSVGTGLKNRAVQSMAMGVPVIGTPVAFEGIALEHGQDAIVVSAASQSIAWYQQLIVNPEARRRIGHAGRRRVLSSFGSEAISARWINLYREVSGNGPSNA